MVIGGHQAGGRSEPSESLAWPLEEEDLLSEDVQEVAAPMELLADLEVCLGTMWFIVKFHYNFAKS